MQGWGRKEAVLRATKSGGVRQWMSAYNEGVPGAIETKIGNRTPREGCVLMTFLTPLRSKYTLDIPVEDVTFDHPWFRHSVPYKGLALVHELEALR